MKEEHLEVKRRHGPTFVEKLRWHFGTLAAIAVLVLLLLQVFKIIGAPSAASQTALDDLTGTVGRVQGKVNGRAFPADERLKSVDEQIGRLRTSLKHVVTPAEAGAGITYPVAYLMTLKPGESNEVRFQAPIELVATAEAGGVELKWAEAANNNVKVGSFEIFRKDAGGEAVRVSSVEGALHNFRDTKALPGRPYEYTVQAIAADPDLANTPRGRSGSSAPATVKALADFKIDLVDWKEGVATIKVSKWHGGAWRDRIFEVREGEAIGQMDQALGIDFSTGRRLAKLTVETSQAPVTRDEIVFDAKGRVVLEQGAPKRVAVSSMATRTKTTAAIAGGDLPDDVLELEKK